MEYYPGPKAERLREVVLQLPGALLVVLFIRSISGAVAVARYWRTA